MLRVLSGGRPFQGRPDLSNLAFYSSCIYCDLILWGKVCLVFLSATWLSLFILSCALMLINLICRYLTITGLSWSLNDIYHKWRMQVWSGNTTVLKTFVPESKLKTWVRVTLQQGSFKAPVKLKLCSSVCGCLDSSACCSCYYLSDCASLVWPLCLFQLPFKILGSPEGGSTICSCVSVCDI